MWWVACLALIVSASPGLAQTFVSEAITVDTHWTSINGPYLISGAVILQNGAELVIDPGVTVYMQADASLVVGEGSIQALGNSTDPIQVLSDKTRLARTAAPGDWKHWAFGPGTVDTRLEHMVFEHGSGLVISGSAPVLNYVEIHDHLGSAISIDLAASPSGVGNSATGNEVNGIVVPAGDIEGNRKWGLRGIPYVVDAGTVSVGTSPSIASITPNQIRQGATTTVDMVGGRLTGLAGAWFDNPGLTAEVLAGATDTRASLSVTASETAAFGPAGVRLLVDAGEIKVVDALMVVPSELNPLKQWRKEGVSGNGDWRVAEDGLSVLQTINGQPTFFVSPTEQILTTIRGRFRVENTNDDDFIGFVFGYRRPIAANGDNSNDYEFLLFDWKRGNQGTGKEGFTLSRVKGSSADLWGHTPSEALDVLASQYATGSGWKPRTDYEFELTYTSTRIRIRINGTTIFDVSGRFDPGRFGFYNYSQAQVRYERFINTQEFDALPNDISALEALPYGNTGLTASSPGLTSATSGVININP